jgi:hypothetical protein
VLFYLSRAERDSLRHTGQAIPHVRLTKCQCRQSDRRRLDRLCVSVTFTKSAREVGVAARRVDSAGLAHERCIASGMPRLRWRGIRRGRRGRRQGALSCKPLHGSMQGRCECMLFLGSLPCAKPTCQSKGATHILPTLALPPGHATATHDSPFERSALKGVELYLRCPRCEENGCRAWQTWDWGMGSNKN